MTNEQRISNIKHEILRLVAENDGKLDWYRLDRALAYGENLEIISRLPELVDELEFEGFLRQVGDGARPNFYLTNAGRRFLETAAEPVAA